MTILVTGARGVLGRRVVAELRVRGHEVRAAGRSGSDVDLDLSTGTGIEEALAGVDAVVHCATDARRHKLVDAEGTRRLLAAARAPIVFPGIVGSDLIPLGYYRSKMRAEEEVVAHNPGYTVLRSTQFHQLLWMTMGLLAKSPLMVVPNQTHAQVVDPGTVARRLADAVETGPRGRVPDVGGRFVYALSDLARSYLNATGRRRQVVRLNLPGLIGAAFRAGANLTPNRDEEGETWNEFVARTVARANQV